MAPAGIRSMLPISRFRWSPHRIRCRPLEGDYLRDGTGVSVIDKDRHFTWFYTRNSHRAVIIKGDVTILVQTDFLMEQKSTIEIEPGGSLTVYVG